MAAVIDRHQVQRLVQEGARAPTSIQDPMVVSDFLDSLVSGLEYFDAERLDDGPITLESGRGMAESLVHGADERAEVAPAVSRQAKTGSDTAAVRHDAFMPSAVTVDHYRLRMKAGDHPFEIVLVERLEVTSDDVLFSSSHVSFLPRAA